MNWVQGFTWVGLALGWGAIPRSRPGHLRSNQSKISLLLWQTRGGGGRAPGSVSFYLHNFAKKALLLLT